MIKVWKPHPGPQTDFCSRWEFEVFYGGPLTLDTLVLTPDGYKKLEEIEVGDLVTIPSGEFSKVIDIPFKGIEPTYELTFNDGIKIKASAGHLWLVSTGDWKKKGGKPWRIKKTIELLDFKLPRGRNKYKIPITSPIRFKEKKHTISPYTLGVLLGDGCFTTYKKLQITNSKDIEILDRINKEAINGYRINKISTIQYQIARQGFGFRGSQNEYIKELKRLDLLGKNASYKFIPDDYKLDSIQNRIALLQGLFDTDGGIRNRERNNTECKYSTISQRLRDDIIFVIQSLGGIASCHIENSRISRKLIYRIYARIETNPFYLSRKANMFKNYNIKAPWRYITDIKEIGRQEVKCITIEDTNHLFLVNGCVVTYNSAGPGKTDCLIMEATRYLKHPGYRAILFRRTYPELEEIIDRAHEMYPSLGGNYRSSEHRWFFPSGAIVKFGHMQHEEDKYAYRGKEYQFIGFDEATRFTGTQYLYLFSRARSIYKDIPSRIRSGSNPGGPGHQFIKDRFKIGIWESGKTIIDPLTGLSRVFIQGRLKDNPTLLLNDPEYIQRLMLLPEIERMRLLEGVWDAFEGQAIPELNWDVHGIPDQEISLEWTRYRSFDWGYSTPFSVGWWAIDFDGMPYRYREWYGAKEGDERNVGLRMSPTEIARGIKEREREETEKGIKIHAGPADPDIWNPRWKKMGKRNFGVVGASIADDMAKEGIHWLQADNDHLLGRQQVHKRLELDEKGNPQIRIFYGCKDFWRTMPLLREHGSNPEDIEKKDAEDHIYDECLHGDTVVCTKIGNFSIKDLVGTEGYVLTIDGKWTKYKHCRLIAKNRETIKVIFEDGRSIQCTPDHKFLTIKGEWVEAKDLFNEICYNSISKLNKEETICKSRLLVKQNRNLMVNYIGYAANIFKEKVNDFIGLFGNTIKVLYQKIIMFIIKMAIDITIKLKILNVFLKNLMPQTMQICEILQNGNEHNMKAPVNGIKAPQGWNGIKNNIRNIVKIKFMKENSIFASIVGKNLWGLHVQNSAPIIANHNGEENRGLILKKESVSYVNPNLKQIDSYITKPVQEHVELSSVAKKGVKVINIIPAGIADVYCLEAEGTHAFGVEQGIIVANCRYFCMFKPAKPKVQIISDAGTFRAERRKLIKARQLAARTGISLSEAYGRVR